MSYCVLCLLLLNTCIRRVPAALELLHTLGTRRTFNWLQSAIPPLEAPRSLTITYNGVMESPWTWTQTARHHKATRRVRLIVSLQGSTADGTLKPLHVKLMKLRMASLTFLTRTISIFVLSWAECSSTSRGNTVSGCYAFQSDPTNHLENNCIGTKVNKYRHKFWTWCNSYIYWK